MQSTPNEKQLKELRSPRLAEESKPSPAQKVKRKVSGRVSGGVSEVPGRPPKTLFFRLQRLVFDLFWGVGQDPRRVPRKLFFFLRGRVLTPLPGRGDRKFATKEQFWAGKTSLRTFGGHSGGRVSADIHDPKVQTSMTPRPMKNFDLRNLRLPFRSLLIRKDRVAGRRCLATWIASPSAWDWDPARPLQESLGPFGPEMPEESPKESPKESYGAFRPWGPKSARDSLKRVSGVSKQSVLSLWRLFRDCFGHFLAPGPEALARLFRRLFVDLRPEGPGRLL